MTSSRGWLEGWEMAPPTPGTPAPPDPVRGHEESAEVGNVGWALPWRKRCNELCPAPAPMSRGQVLLLSLKVKRGAPRLGTFTWTLPGEGLWLEHLCDTVRSLGCVSGPQLCVWGKDSGGSSKRRAGLKSSERDPSHEDHWERPGDPRRGDNGRRPISRHPWTDEW